MNKKFILIIVVMLILGLFVLPNAKGIMSLFSSKVNVGTSIMNQSINIIKDGTSIINE